MRQFDYGYAIPSGVPGGIYDLSNKEVVTRLLDDGEETVPGMGLVQGAKPGDTVKSPTGVTTSDDFDGIFVNGSKNLENDRYGNAVAKGANALGIMKHGKIWANIAGTTTVSYGKKVAFITDGDNAGKFTDEANDSEATKVTIDAKFNGKVDKENGIAVIELK